MPPCTKLQDWEADLQALAYYSHLWEKEEKEDLGRKIKFLMASHSLEVFSAGGESMNPRDILHISYKMRYPGCRFQTDIPPGPCPTSVHCSKLLGRFSLSFLVFLCPKSSDFSTNLHGREFQLCKDRNSMIWYLPDISSIWKQWGNL